jgi:EPS-associated MarR family transcriptional regulator
MRAPCLTKRESLDFELLHLLETEPGLSQREIADRLEISLGRVNYCLKGLTEKGAVKLANFRASEYKLRYIFVLTPNGIAERTALISRYLQRKLAEYERLKAQIESLQRELPGGERH